MTSELLTSLAGSLLSLAFSYLPGLKEAYNRLTAVQKRLVMLTLLGLTAAALYGLSCAGFAPQWGLPATCGEAGALFYLKLFFDALAANQATYLLTPHTAPNGNGLITQE